MNFFTYNSLLALFILAVLIQLGYAVLFRFRKQEKRNRLPPPDVSVIICARNEAANLQQFLPFVLEQDYPGTNFEVIVVDDGSLDQTTAILNHFRETYPQLKIVTLTTDTVKDLPGKKYALARGIEAARYDRLLLTDADCKPASDQWLQEMVSTGSDIILGYGAYETHPGLLNRFIRWETVHTCMQYASYARAGRPYMGVGRNLSYRKSLLETAEKDDAFQQIYRNTPSGDDDLLICRIATRKNTATCLDQDAFTISIPQKTWKAWWRQKTRHASTGKYYPTTTKNLLGLYGLSHTLYWFLGIPAMGIAMANCQLPISKLLISLFLLRLFVCWINAANWYRRLNEKKLSLFYPLGDLGWAIYNVFLSPYILWKNKQTWK